MKPSCVDAQWRIAPLSFGNWSHSSAGWVAGEWTCCRQLSWISSLNKLILRYAVCAIGNGFCSLIVFGVGVARLNKSQHVHHSLVSYCERPNPLWRDVQVPKYLLRPIVLWILLRQGAIHTTPCMCSSVQRVPLYQPIHIDNILPCLFITPLTATACGQKCSR